MLLLPGLLDGCLEAPQDSGCTCWAVLLQDHLCNGLGGLELLLLLLSFSHVLNTLVGASL